MSDFSLAEAAKRLGTTTEAVRARVKRKSLEGFRDNRGRWRVLMPDGQTGDQMASAGAAGRVSGQAPAASELDQMLAQMREQVARLEAKLEGTEARLADRDRELAEVKVERDRLLGMLQEAQTALVLRKQGIFTQLWDHLFGAADK